MTAERVETATDVAVIGGGIAGLAAAWELCADPARPTPGTVTLIEADDRFGGKIRSTGFAGAPVDEGADAFLRRVPDALRLCEEIGFDDLVSPATGRAFLWTGEQLTALPTGTVMGLPVRFDDLGGVLSPAGVARATTEPDLGPEAPVGLHGDETIGALVRRRYGDEVADRLVAPLIGGINAGDIDRLSLRTMLPQVAAAMDDHPGRPLSRVLQLSTADGPVFAGTPRGMGSVVDRLVDGLRSRGVRLLTGSPVASMSTVPGGWRLVLGSDGLIEARGVVVASPATEAARLLREFPTAAAVLDSVVHSSVVLVTLAYHRGLIGHPMDGSGFLVPRGTGPRITAVSWASSKWAHLDRAEAVMLRVSLGHRDDPAAIDLDDDDLVHIVVADLRTTMGIEVAPEAVRISRWRDAFPQFAVGHLDRVAEVRAALDAAPSPVALAGAVVEGVGIPACIRSGRAAARVVADGLST